MQKWLKSIYSDGSKHFVSNPLPKLGETVSVKLRVLSDAPVIRVVLRRKVNGNETLIDMEKAYTKGNFDYYQCDLQINESYVHYHFFIVTDEQIYYYNQYEVTDCIPTEAYDFRILADYESPEWVKSSVFYQIFPDRFYNGNEANDVQTGEYTFDGHSTIKVEWGSKPLEYEDGHCLDFYGGDLEGIKAKIPYFKKLGVNALYLNPIFYSATNHKYDCVDFFSVDPHFGGDKALQDLIKELHKNDMKIIIDVSINHTGTAHKWFNRDKTFFDETIGAYWNPEAKERGYYFFGDENNYHGWLGVETLPTLNYASEELKSVLYKDDASLVKKWLKPPYNIDGWRFDVANTMARMDEDQLHHEVWPAIRKSIKSENKEAYIVGEHWSDCNEFLKGDEWDTAMNYYGFGRPVRHFVGEQDLYLSRDPQLKAIRTNLTSKNFGKRIMQHLARLPHQLIECQYNLFDSHDVYRLHANDEIDFQSYRSAVIMMFTFPGTPNIYYGDEVGIGGHDTIEGCRYPMVWEEEQQDKAYFNLYSTLAHMKLEEDVLQTGGFKVLYDEGYVFAYARFNEDKAYIGICSMEDEDKIISIPLDAIGNPGNVTEVFDHEVQMKQKDTELEVTIPAKKGYLLAVDLVN